MTLSPSLPSPQLVGTTITWTAAATGAANTVAYKYSTMYLGSTRMIRDFSVANTFDWTPATSDGDYQMQVVARDNVSQESAVATVPFQVTSRVLDRQTVVSSTANPLVVLVSAPSCAAGNSMIIKFEPTGLLQPTYTTPQACHPPSSMNFYVAGMYPDTNYTITPLVKFKTATSFGGTISPAASVSFHTGVTSGVSLPEITVVRPFDGRDSLMERILLWGGITSGFPFATDMKGTILWYYPASNNTILMRLLSGGNSLVTANGPNSQGTATRGQILREIDLAGNILRETNATRVQEQLAAMGVQTACVSGSTQCVAGAFHHDAIRLPNGRTIALADVERVFPPGTQGSTTDVDIMGDVLIELDDNWQVVWYWNAFDHLDVNRPAVLKETCGASSGNCPPIFLGRVANDWLHTNTIQLTPDGNLMLSLRHQDWIIKIDYRNGAGTGQVLWRMGQGGDFSISSTDPWPWFSHQHDSGFEADGTLTVFDNGNTRVAAQPGQHSRGQVFSVDEIGKTVTPLLNADLRVFSFALGSAQLLHNGNYHFLPGIVNPGPFSESVEVLQNGNIPFALQANVPVYRSFRVSNLYNPPAT